MEGHFEYFLQAETAVFEAAGGYTARPQDAHYDLETWRSGQTTWSASWTPYT